MSRWGISRIGAVRAYIQHTNYRHLAERGSDMITMDTYVVTWVEFCGNARCGQDFELYLYRRKRIYKGRLPWGMCND